MLKGAFDLHVHAAPSLFERWGDATDLARACLKAKMAGFVLKAHHGSTVETAAVLRRCFPKLKAYGGVVLNRFVGGLNPHAADACLRLGGKIVWMPTIHAAYHARKLGAPGGFSFQRSKARLKPGRGITVLGGRGTLVPAAKDILHLLSGGEAALGTGHLSPREIFAVRDYLRKARLRVRLLVNHVFFSGLTLGHLRELQGPRTWFEAAYFTVSPMSRRISVGHVARTLRALPDAQWVLVSDSGQKRNPRCPDALKRFAEALAKEGITRNRIEAFLKRHPRRLLAPIGRA